MTAPHLRDPRLTLLVLGTAATAGIVLDSTWTQPQPTVLLFWAVTALVAELMWVRLPLGQATISMASCAHLAALLVLPGSAAMAITAVTGGLAEGLVLRKPPMRVLFNASQSALAVGAASAVFALAGRGTVLAQLTRGEVWPALLAAAAYAAVNTGLVSLAVGWSEGMSPVEAWRRNFGHRGELIATGALLSLGILLASHYEAAGMAGTILVVFPVVLAHQGYRHLIATRLDESGDQARAA